MKKITVLISVILVAVMLFGCAENTANVTNTGTDILTDEVTNGETKSAETTEPGTGEPETTAEDTVIYDTTAEEETTTVQEITTEPETTAPETTVPETTVPETTAPETTAPETTVPVTTAPETTAPETTVPETTVPETTAPETTSPPPAPVEEFEEVVLYPENDVSHEFDADTLERLYSIYAVTGRNIRHICPGERFQIRIAAKEDDIKVSVKDVAFEITDGKKLCELTDNGVFTAKSAGTVKITATLKSSGLKANMTVTIKEPAKKDLWQGSGTFSDPYLINTVDDFMKIHTISAWTDDYTSGGYWFKQTADLDFSGIEYVAPARFMSNYDGGGHKIKNVTYDALQENAGLFGYATGSVIKNLTIENFTYKRNGTVSAGNAGTFISSSYSVTMVNCHAVNVDIDISGNGECGDAGGIAGHITETSSFVNCSASGAVKGTYCAGGFYGLSERTAWHTVFVNCSSKVSVSSENDTAGGFCGKPSMFNVYYDCTSTQPDEGLESYNIKTK